MNRIAISRSQRLGVVGVAVAALILAVVVLNSTGGSSLTTAGDETDGPLAPDAEFALFDGGTASFADFEGKPLVVNFWASWCPACVAELPEFEKVHQELGDEVTFLGLANADRRDAADALAAEIGLSYQLADDPDGELFRSLELIAMPSTLFISADGRVAEVFAGQLNEAALLERIEDLQVES
ncbi:MAG: TlpA family protein disulfide reductase [Acidimicrobiales bacterium]